MKAKLTWIIPVILLINLFIYELTIQNANHRTVKNQPKSIKQTARNVAGNLNLSLNYLPESAKTQMDNKNENIFFLLKDNKDIDYEFFCEIGFDRRSYDSFTVVVDNYIRDGSLSYMDMYMLFNYEGFVDYFHNKGYREGINSLNPESMKDKIVSRVAIDSFDTKNTCGYYNAHKSFLFKIFDEAVEIGLFNTYHTWAAYKNAINWVIFKLEDYYFNPGLRNKKEKIIGPYDENINISMEETKKGN